MLQMVTLPVAKLPVRPFEPGTVPESVRPWQFELRILSREWWESAGLGFELGELGYKSRAPIRPSLVA